MRNKRSPVWLYCEVIDKTTAKCLLCNRVLKSHGSTGNLIDHLRRRHSSIISISSVDTKNADENHQEGSESVFDAGNDVETNTGAHFLMKRSKLDTDNVYNHGSDSKTADANLSEVNFCNNSNFVEQDVEEKNLRSMHLNSLLVDMIAGDFHPISMIQGEGFREFVHVLDPTYVLPTRREFLTNYLANRYEKARSQVKSLIDQAEYVSLAVDIWKLKYRCFLTCTAYCIIDLKLHCFLLATEQIPFNYTQKSIVSALSTIAVDWDIDNKIASVVIENNPILRSSIEELELPYLPCIAHSVDLLVAEVFKNPALLHVRQVCQTLANHFAINAACSNKLIEIQLYTNQPKLKLLNEKPSKWRTTVAMFKRLLKMKVAVNLVIKNVNGSPETLTEAEWDVLSDCVMLLSPLVEMMRKLFSEKYQIASQIIPLVHTAQELIISSRPVSIVGSNLKSALITGCKEKLALYNDSNVTVLSTLLDPRLKEFGFSDETCVENASESLINELSTIHKNSLNENPEEFEELLEDDYTYNLTVSEDIAAASEVRAIQDFRRYSCMAFLCRKSGDPLLFWEESRDSFPHLAKLGLKHMCVPAHLLQAKRIFSKFRFARMLRTSNLKAKKNIDKMIFLHAFCKLIDYHGLE